MNLGKRFLQNLHLWARGWRGGQRGIVSAGLEGLERKVKWEPAVPVVTIERCGHAGDAGASILQAAFTLRESAVGRKNQRPVVFELAARAPYVGLVFAIALAGEAIHLQWFNRKAFAGMAPVFGVFFWAFAVMAFLGALLGFFEQWKRSRRLNSIYSIDGLFKLSPGEFEEVIADLFRRQGYRVEERGGPGDGGVDLVLRRNGNAAVAHLVQCKRYRSWKVRLPEVREFFGAMAAFRTKSEGIFVTCGSYTDEAVRFASDKPIRLIDGNELVAMLQNVNPIAPAVESFTTSPPPTTSGVPLCPQCRLPMTRRIAQRGDRAGKPFWGCVNYPRCRGIVNIEM